MDLLFCAVEEYVLEHHHEWALYFGQGTDQWFILPKHLKKQTSNEFVSIRTNKNALAIHRTNVVEYQYYTEATLLSQITKAIEQIESS